MESKAYHTHICMYKSSSDIPKYILNTNYLNNIINTIGVITVNLNLMYIALSKRNSTFIFLIILYVIQHISPLCVCFSAIHRSEVKLMLAVGAACLPPPIRQSIANLHSHVLGRLCIN